MCLLGNCRRPAYFKPLRGLLRASPFFLQTDGAVTEECICTIHTEPTGKKANTRVTVTVTDNANDYENNKMYK